MMLDITKLTEEEKINIEKIEARFGTDYILTTKHNLAYNCPFCDEKRGKADNDHKFMVDAKTTLYWCFKCHTKGLLISTNISNSEKIVPFLMDYFTESNDESDSKVKNNKLLDFSNTIDITSNSLAYEYLVSRKITKEQILYYNIKNGINDNLGRIMIPNILVAKWADFYQGRSYLDAEPKYRNPSEVDKSDFVFNLHNQKKYQKRIYIVEGIFSAIRAGYDAVSILGSSISDTQIKLISKYKFKEIYCCLDGDSAGQIGNLDMANKLITATNSNIYIVKLPEKDDPADMGEDRFKDYCEKYKHLFVDNKIDSILSYFD